MYRKAMKGTMPIPQSAESCVLAPPLRSEVSAVACGELGWDHRYDG